MDNIIAVVIGLIMFFASWFVMGLAFNTTIPLVVFLLAMLLMTASVSLPLLVLERLDRR